MVVLFFVCVLVLIFCAVSPLYAFSNCLVKFGWLSGHLLGKWLPIRLVISSLSISA